MPRMIVALTLLTCVLSALGAEPGPNMRRYNVVWDSPSKDASGVMPLGNGDIAAGVYVIENGALYLLLSKNDAYTYQGDLFKTGRVRIALEPNPFQSGKPFRQTLDLATGSIQIEADGVRVSVWADANRNVYHVEVSAPNDITVSGQPEFWKRFDACSFNDSHGYTPSATPPPQDVRLERAGKVLWYYSVGDRSILPDDLKFYNVEQMAGKIADPFRFNTFGNLLESPSLTLKDGVLTGGGRRFDIRIHALCMQTPDASQWIAALENQAAQPVDAKADWEKHCRWWSDFWARGWVIASDRTVPAELREKLAGEATRTGQREEEDGAALVSQSYNVFRFLMACQSRGRVQTKFNGGLFTQQLRVRVIEKRKRSEATDLPDGMQLTHEDDRLWGRRFTYQNQRLLYWPLLASGDFDLMQPFFQYYAGVLEMRKAVTKAWFGHDGAYYRENIEPDGAERDCGNGGKPPKTKPGETYKGWYHDYYFTSGLETTAMMLDYVNFTRDETFRDRVLVPFARDVLRFFDLHYPRSADGKIRLEPAQVVETWWVAVNPAPDIAGLHFALDGLLAMKAGTADDQSNWRRLRGELPPVALQTIGGQQAIAPAEKWEKKHNAENGELYPVFPFRCFGLALGSKDVVDSTMQHRACKDSFGSACWTQDQIDWACAGNATEASAGLVRRFRIASPMCRFPLFAREGPDSCPDFDHFGSGSVALQRMLVQEGGGKILLLPAWPEDWDVDFKLHLSGSAIISGVVKDGALRDWSIQPELRRADVTVCALQKLAVLPGVPPNTHDLRVGADQSGGSRFKGEFARVTMYRRALKAAEISALAGGDRTRAITGDGVVDCRLSPKAGDKLPTQPADFAGAVSFEAWIYPAENESGRILDKITVGGADGFLFDTFPKLSLRLIAGSHQRTAQNVLKSGAWQHVAIVINRGRPEIYLNGEKQ